MPVLSDHIDQGIHPSVVSSSTCCAVWNCWIGLDARIATCGNVESEHSIAANESPRRIDEVLMVVHQHRGNEGFGVAVNPALGTPSSLSGGVKAHKRTQWGGPFPTSCSSWARSTNNPNKRTSVVRTRP